MATRRRSMLARSLVVANGSLLIAGTDALILLARSLVRLDLFSDDLPVID